MAINNLYFGLIIILLCGLGYYISWKYWTKDNYVIAIALLLLCGLSLRLFTSCDFFLHEWDERYHALVSKNLIQHPLLPTLYDTPLLDYDYKTWIANHIWVHKQPMPLWIMAASMWLFGINEIALRLPSILISTLGIYLTFYIGSYYFSKKNGYLAALLFSINGLIIELTAGRVATDHIDIYFLFFIELAIFFSIQFIQKHKMVFNILAGISIGAAILSKWLPALIVLPIWLLIVAESGSFKTKEIIKHFFIVLLTTLLVFLPWQIYIFQAFPNEAKWEAGFNLKHITEVLEGQTGPFYYFANKIRTNYGELIYLPLLWFLWKTLKNLNNKKYVSITIWFLIPLLFFSFLKTKMQGYILFTAPALFILTAEFWLMLYEYKKTYSHKWAISIILILMIALPVRYTIERVKPFEESNRQPQWVVDLKKMKSIKYEKGVLFNYSKPIEAMFYTNLTVYPNIPDSKTINNLKLQGYTILINSEGKIPEEIKRINGIEIVNLKTSDY